MDALADKVNKQGEHIPQHLTQPSLYVSRSDTLRGTITISTAMRCSNVMECALLVCLLCQPVHPSTHSLHFVDFSLKSF